MANRIYIKRSNVAGKIPTSADIDLGEMALNTADVKLYASGTTANQILPIGWDRIARTGDTVTGNFRIIGNLTGNSVTVLNDLVLSGLTEFTGTSTNIGVDANGKVVTLPIDETLTVNVSNKTGVTIPKGSVVYINGAQGSKATIALALADSNPVTSFALGITLQAIANNANGLVVTNGIASGLDTSLFTNGDTVYLSATIAGGLTNIAPVSPNHTVLIGTVTNSHATQGIILVRVEHTFKLDEISDVVITGATNNDVLTYETSSGLWKNKPIGGIITFTGTTNFLQKLDASSALTNSNIVDDGITISATTDMRVNGLTLGRGAGNVSSNVIFGLNAFTANTTGFENIAFGFNSLQNNTTGFYNSAIGSYALYNNTTGILNSAFGFTSLQGNIGGSNNTAFGYNTLPNNGNGNSNTAIGESALSQALDLSNNTAIGAGALGGLSIGDDNIAIGREAGKFAHLVGDLTDTQRSIYIGALSTGLGLNNEIIIGYRTFGRGSHTTVIGNDDILSTYLGGNLVLGSTINNAIVDNGVNRIQSHGSILSTAFIKSGGTANQFLMADGSVTTGSTSITFTGTTNFVQKLDANSALTDSNIFDNGTLIELNSNTDIFGNVTANAIIKSGGTSNQFLMADGSVTTSTIVLTGTTNFVQKLDANSALTNSLIYDNGTSIGFDTINLTGDSFITLGSQFDRKIAIETSIEGSGKTLTVSAGNSVIGTGGGGGGNSEIFQVLPNDAFLYIGCTVGLNGDVYANVNAGDIYVQTGGFGTFVATGSPNALWRHMTTANNGDVYACVLNGDIYKQTGGVGAFNPLGETFRAWYGMTTNTTNGDIYAGVVGGDIYKQTGGVGSFVALGQTNRDYTGLAELNGDIYASVYTGDIYKQTGGVGSFVALGVTTRNWQGLTSVGNNLYGVTDGGGDLWVRVNNIGDFVGTGQVPRTYFSLTSRYDNIYSVGDGFIVFSPALPLNSETLTVIDSVGDAFGVAVAPNDDVYVSVFGGDIYKQTGGVGAFNALGQAFIGWRQMVANSAGDIYAVTNGDDIYKQTGGVGDFIGLGQPFIGWYGICINSTNGDVYATEVGGDIYVQTGGVGNFNALGETARSWTGIAELNGDIYALDYAGDLYKQTGGVGAFVAQGVTPRNWQSIVSLGDKLYAQSDNDSEPSDLYVRAIDNNDFVGTGQESRAYRDLAEKDNNLWSVGTDFIAFSPSIGSGVDTSGGILKLESGIGFGGAITSIDFNLPAITTTGFEQVLETKMRLDNNGILSVPIISADTINNKVINITPTINESGINILTEIDVNGKQGLSTKFFQTIENPLGNVILQIPIINTTGANIWTTLTIRVTLKDASGNYIGSGFGSCNVGHNIFIFALNQFQAFGQITSIDTGFGNHINVNLGITSSFIDVEIDSIGDSVFGIEYSGIFI